MKIGVTAMEMRFVPHSLPHFDSMLPPSPAARRLTLAAALLDMLTNAADRHGLTVRPNRPQPHFLEGRKR
jgi:hypothetical protein